MKQSIHETKRNRNNHRQSSFFLLEPGCVSGPHLELLLRQWDVALHHADGRTGGYPVVDAFLEEVGAECTIYDTVDT